MCEVSSIVHINDYDCDYDTCCPLMNCSGLLTVMERWVKAELKMGKEHQRRHKHTYLASSKSACEPLPDLFSPARLHLQVSFVP